MSAQIESLFETLRLGSTSEERTSAAHKLATLVKQQDDVHFLKTHAILDHIRTDAENIKTWPSREGAMLAIQHLCSIVGKACEPYVLPLLPLVLERYGDKVGEVRTAAEAAANAFIDVCSPHAVKAILPNLFEAIENAAKWQSKWGALQLINHLRTAAPRQIRASMPDLIPVISAAMWATKAEVKNYATTLMNDLCKCVENPDIEQFIPALISSIADPTEVPECVYKLSATTFVTTVEAPTLAIMLPLLVRGLGESATAVKRQCAVIIANMCKLVQDPSEAEFFLPKLMPGLDRIIEMAADPELRSQAERARAILLRAGGQDHGMNADENLVAVHKVTDEGFLLKTLKEVIVKIAPKAKKEVEDEFCLTTLKYVASLTSEAIMHKCIDKDDWNKTCVTPYVAFFLGQKDAQAVCTEFLARCLDSIEAEKAKQHEEDDDEGEDLCNCEFSLAYGGMILLNNTTMRLKRGRRYGLCGPNGVGKSTLMRAIANGQVDGFPPADVLKTVFVEHKLQGEEAEMPVCEFIFNDEQTKHLPRDKIVTVLKSVGFDDEKQSQPVASLSGGWKMKLELARAMLVNADILLLDEPTNHLDVRNVKWLEDYLTGLENVTCMIVSHDSKFLDNVCTDIIHYENRKLKRYRGNLSEFVKVKPEAKTYYELEAASTKFVLPEPGFLEGINSKDKLIMKMVKINFQYPGTSKKQLNDITIGCSLSSRVACLGPNGAGKSTLIKVLTGELNPDDGDVWKHPNLRVAYVAQHAFHHLEQHLDKTPNQYVQWRYQFGEDKELLAKESRQLTDEEKKLMEQKVLVEGEKRQLESIVGRRKVKKTYEYEIKWVGLSYDDNTWVMRDQLERWGFTKMVIAFDDKESAKAGMYARPLTSANVQKHFEDLGLDPEFSTHSRIRGLSGGQKVKVVIGAAMWNNPHMLIMDEPTNYLDRESLGALATAIKEYGGGVVIISHNSEFVSHVCPETWTMADGHLEVKGGIVIKEKIVQKEVTETVDAFGNVIKVKSQKTKFTRKELKAREKRRAAAKARGEEVSDDDEDWGDLA